MGRGRPLVLLHGLFGSADNLRSIAIAFAVDHTVWIPDARNHGASPHAPEMDYDLMAGDLMRFFEDHSLHHAHVVGHSMGGKIAMRLALLSPDRVERLAVVDIAPGLYAPRHLEILQSLSQLDLPRFQDRRLIESSLADAIPDLAVRRFLLKNLSRDGAGEFHWKMNLSALNSEYPKLNADVTGRGGKPFEKPCLFVRGELSDYITAADEPLIRKWFPSAEFRNVPGAGHWVHAEAPAAFLKILREFLT